MSDEKTSKDCVCKQCGRAHETLYVGETTPAVASKPLFVGPCSCSGVPHWHPNPGVTQADVDACVIRNVVQGVSECGCNLGVRGKNCADYHPVETRRLIAQTQDDTKETK